MDAASQQKILGYFIEEAKEHLETLEKGILELSSVVTDTERVNEMFRAAHSLKGGAAMLGYTSIQKTAHRLEDGFKILKEQDVPVDQKLETLFFKVYDILQILIEKLQSPFGLREEDGNHILVESEPHFVKLQSYLNQLLGNEQAEAEPEISASTPTTKTTPKTASNLSEQVRVILREMLRLFKQQPTPQTRGELQNFCVKLAKLLNTNEDWQKLMKTAYKAIGNPKYSYVTLAPVVIKEIKDASDLVASGQNFAIKPSQSLQQLASAKISQVLVPVEPKAAAKILLQSFNQQQLSQLVQLLNVK